MPHVLCFIDLETTGVDPDLDFPIEIGILFSDYKCIHELATIHHKVSTPEMVAYYNNHSHIAKDQWAPEHTSAYKVHNIGFDDWQNSAIDSRTVASSINQICYYLQQKYSTSTFILVSDNIYFDLSFLHKLWRSTYEHWPFHYNGWDTDLLLYNTVGDITGKPHNAMDDVTLLFKQTKKALRDLRSMQRKREQEPVKDVNSPSL